MSTHTFDYAARQRELNEATKGGATHIARDLYREIKEHLEPRQYRDLIPKLTRIIEHHCIFHLMNLELSARKGSSLQEHLHMLELQLDHMLSHAPQLPSGVALFPVVSRDQKLGALRLIQVGWEETLSGSPKRPGNTFSDTVELARDLILSRYAPKLMNLKGDLSFRIYPDIESNRDLDGKSVGFAAIAAWLSWVSHFPLPPSKSVFTGSLEKPRSEYKLKPISSYTLPQKERAVKASSWLQYIWIHQNQEGVSDSNVLKTSSVDLFIKDLIPHRVLEQLSKALYQPQISSPAPEENHTRLQYEMIALIYCSLTDLKRHHLEELLSEGYNLEEVENTRHKMKRLNKIEEVKCDDGTTTLKLREAPSDLGSSFKGLAYERLRRFWPSQVTKTFAEVARPDLAYHYAYLDHRVHHDELISWPFFENYLKDSSLNTVYDSLGLSSERLDSEILKDYIAKDLLKAINKINKQHEDLGTIHPPHTWKLRTFYLGMQLQRLEEPLRSLGSRLLEHESHHERLQTLKHIFYLICFINYVDKEAHCEFDDTIAKDVAHDMKIIIRRSTIPVVYKSFDRAQSPKGLSAIQLYHHQHVDYQSLNLEDDLDGAVRHAFEELLDFTHLPLSTWLKSELKRSPEERAERKKVQCSSDHELMVDDQGALRFSTQRVRGERVYFDAQSNSLVGRYNIESSTRDPSNTVNIGDIPQPLAARLARVDNSKDSDLIFFMKLKQTLNVAVRLGWVTMLAGLKIKPEICMTEMDIPLKKSTKKLKNSQGDTIDWKRGNSFNLIEASMAISERYRDEVDASPLLKRSVEYLKALTPVVVQMRWEMFRAAPKRDERPWRGILDLVHEELKNALSHAPWSRTAETRWTLIARCHDQPKLLDLHNVQVSKSDMSLDADLRSGEVAWRCASSGEITSLAPYLAMKDDQSLYVVAEFQLPKDKPWTYHVENVKCTFPQQETCQPDSLCPWLLEQDFDEMLTV